MEERDGTWVDRELVGVWSHVLSGTSAEEQKRRKGYKGKLKPAENFVRGWRAQSLREQGKKETQNLIYQ